jgi:hypothetical protein
MAITIQNQITAGALLPSNNDINITVNSDNNGYCSFRYICDLYVNDIKVFTWKLFPDPSTGWGFFQLANVIDDYLTHLTPQNNVANIYVGSTSTNLGACKVYCKFGEEYDTSSGCDGTVNQYYDLATSNVIWAYYGALQYEDYPRYLSASGWEDYKVNLTSGVTDETLFLTNIIRGSVDVSWPDSYYLDFLSLTAPNTSTNRLTIDIYYKGGTSSQINITPATMTPSIRWRVSVGPNDINRSQNSPVINSNVSHYDVYLTNSGTRLTEKFRFNVKAPNAFRTRVGFINTLGSIDYHTFFWRNREAIQIERSNYKKFLTTRSGSQQKYEVGDREASTWNTRAKAFNRVSTFVSEDQSKWMWELWTTTDAWVDIKPTTLKFRAFREDSTPTSRMLFWLDSTEDLAVGDYLFSIPDNNALYEDYLARFQITEIVNGNVIDCGLTFNIYNITEEACGWFVKVENLVRVPILIEDTNVEVKQKLDKPIEYILTYSKSSNKKTLRG